MEMQREKAYFFLCFSYRMKHVQQVNMETYTHLQCDPLECHLFQVAKCTFHGCGQLMK